MINETYKWYDRIDLGEAVDVAKSNNSKEWQFATIGNLIMGLNFKDFSVMVIMIY